MTSVTYCENCPNPEFSATKWCNSEFAYCIELRFCIRDKHYGSDSGILGWWFCTECLEYHSSYNNCILFWLVSQICLKKVRGQDEINDMNANTQSEVSSKE